jgi:hypothetical protein
VHAVAAAGVEFTNMVSDLLFNNYAAGVGFTNIVSDLLFNTSVNYLLPNSTRNLISELCC